MTEVVLATRNRGKLREFERLLDGLDIGLHPLSDFTHAGEVEENGETFEENAVKKAKEVSGATGLVAIADDSGLVVDALDGRPGVMSARYAGKDATDSDNNQKLLEELKGVSREKRSAAFVCIIAAADPSGRVVTAAGRCDGLIAFEPRGEGGFGYDPLFYLPDQGCTMAELPPDLKNSISHRGRAVKKLREILPGFLKQRGD